MFAHGSSVESANESVRAVAQSLARSAGYQLIESAFLECAAPDLAAAIARLVEQGARRVLVIPYFLTLGLHLQRDLPRIVAEIRRDLPHIEIAVTEPLDGHPALVEVLADRAHQGLQEWLSQPAARG